MGAAILPAIGGGIAFAAHTERAVIGGERAARQQAWSVVMVKYVGPPSVMPVMMMVVVAMMMGSRLRGSRDQQ